GIDNLSLLVAGPAPGDPCALLESPASPRLLEEVAGRWDVVIIDTTPVLPVADTRILAPAADVALVIARLGVSNRAALAETLAILRQPGRPRIEVVLNACEPGLLLSRGFSLSLSQA